MKQPRWLKIVITVPPQLIDSLTDFLVGVIGAGVESGARDSANYGRVTAWLPEENCGREQQEKVIKQTKEHLAVLEELFHTSGGILHCETVADRDWGAEWKKFFTPFSVIPGLVIVPSWEEYLPKDNEQTVVMDPGMAFGTGHHDTTRLSLELLRNSVEEKGGRSMLDVGTGTGILTMGAVLFGVDRIVAIDNDPDAVDAAQKNIERNRLYDTAQHIEVSTAPLCKVEGEFDIVVANIVYNVLMEMRDDLAVRVKPGGSLILSGILVGEQLDNITQNFTGAGLTKEESRTGEEWAACRFIK